MFSPLAKARVEYVGGVIPVVIVDGALSEPELWVERAQSMQASFELLAGNAYPGLELHLPKQASTQLERLMITSASRVLGVGRALAGYTRLAMVTRLPAQLAPAQWICHRDRSSPAAGAEIGIAASVLYLFKDAGLGGTGFYRPRFDEAKTMQLVRDSVALSAPEFRARYAIEPGYLTQSNSYFEFLGSVEACFNRLIFYRGECFHSSHILAPERLSSQPARARLTMNGFFECELAGSRGTELMQ
jgi:hypothetical protein